MKKSKFLRRTGGMALAAACLASLTIPASAASISIDMPAEPMSVESTDGTRYLTTTAQRASSEIPLVLGINVVGGNLFNGAVIMAGTNINDNPDPYIWNYNYLYPGTEIDGGQLAAGDPRPDAPADFDMSTVYEHGISSGQIGGASNGGMVNGNGLYSSGGANQVMGIARDDLGNVSYGVYHTIDVWIGFYSDVLEQIDFVQNEMDKTSEYYQEAYATYDPLITDCATGTVTSRAYAWVEMGNALSAYLKEHPELSARYGDPQALCYNLQEFAFGIPYYIDSLIAAEKIEKITGACISAADDSGTTFTTIDPLTAGDVKADSYAVGNTVNWLVGTYTMADLLKEGVDVIVIYSAGYGYVESTGPNAGGGPGGAGGPGARAGESTSGTLTRTYLEGLMEDLECSVEDAPVVIDAANESVTAGSNGYNYAPTTPLYVPQITAYMYLDQLNALAASGDEIAAAINPIAMFQYACDEFFHIKDDSAATIAAYWIGDTWSATDSDLDKSPDTASYVYDKALIVEAIQQGIQFALNNQDNEDVYINGAYRQGECAYTLAMMVVDGGYDSFAEILEEADGDYTNITYDYENDLVWSAPDITPLVDFYGIDGLAALVDDYVAHMNNHAWVPDTTVVGTYGYGMAPQIFTDLDEENGGWYIDAVQWAVALGITNGVDETTFAPNLGCTRAQVVTFLWRAAGCPQPTTTTNDFTDLDASEYGDWYRTAVQWAVENGITNGMTETTFEPETTCTRAQIVTFLYRFENTPDAGASDVFTDVTADAYYADAVAWALENGITNGMTETTFEPETTCTRAHVVTFLYRDIA